MNVKISNLLHNLQQKSLKELISLYIEGYKNQILIGILIFAFLIRVKRISQGLPYILNPFEVEYLENSFVIMKDFFSIHSFEVPFFYILLNTVTLFFTTLNTNLPDYIAALEMNPQDLYIPLRSLSLIFSLGSIIILYFIGKKISALIGILSSLFLSLSLINVQYSHLASPSSGLIFFILLTTLFSIKSLEEKTNKNYLWAFCFATVSSLMHYIGFISFLSPIVSLYINKDLEKLKKYLKITSVIYFIFNPYFIFSIINIFLTGIHRYVYGYYTFHFSSFFLYAYQYIVQGIGPVIYLTTFILFFKYKSHYRKDFQKTIFILPLAYLSFLVLFHITHSSYTNLFIPYFCLASAMFFNSLCFNNKNKFVFILLILFAIWIPLKYTDKYNKTIGLADTRVIASEWLRQKTSEESKIVYSKKTLQLQWFDLYRKELIKDSIDDPELLINKERFSLSSKIMKDKNWYKILKKKADYVVISSIDTEKAYRHSGYFNQKKFYKKFEKLKPKIVFNPYIKQYDQNIRGSFYDEFFYPYLSLWERERSGPIIKIYKI